MIRIPNYHIHQKLSENKSACLYRASQETTSEKVLIKTSTGSELNPHEQERFHHEYSIMKHLVESSHIPKPLDFLEVKGWPVLVFEDPRGQVLEDLLGDHFDLENALKIGIALAKAIADIHNRGVIHKDIKPSNFLISKDLAQAEIFNFEIATLLPLEYLAAAPVNVLQGTLEYMSPEQTGRMNRAIDYRSDLYSLGVTLYRLLANELPFSARDPLSWCYCHLAIQPKPLDELCPSLSPSLVAIVHKLMAKMAEDRYQSAMGLCRDLERCAGDLQATGSITDFDISVADTPLMFSVPQKLYGREREKKVLLKGFEAVIGDGKPRMILVGGVSGVGKSSLVHELYKPIVRTRSLFLKGKFDQYRRNIPYETLIQVFQAMIRQILTESVDEVAEWKKRISEALGKNGRVITEVIPEVELIVGAQPEIAELAPSQAKNRFNMVFQNFVRVLAREDCPLLIFLDDMQWADNAPLQMLRILLNDSLIHHLCFICAYRSNEVGPSHPFRILLDNLEQDGHKCNSIQLDSLDSASIRELVLDTFSCDHEVEGIHALARIVSERTQGNPFFVAQFLKRLHREHMVRLDPESSGYLIDIEKIVSLSYTENVIELMVARLSSLEKPVQQVIQVASCVGNQFSMVDLVGLLNRTPAQVSADLWPAIQENLVIPLNDEYKVVHRSNKDHDRLSRILYRFQHDRIQQAGYALIREERRAEIHLKLGRMWRRAVDEENLDEIVFRIVTQLNQAINLIVDPQERLDLARLNLRAGQKARASTAYATASHLLTQAQVLLGKNSWKHHYALTFEVLFEFAGCQYLCGEFDTAEALFKEVIDHSLTLAEKIQIYIMRLCLHQVSGNYSEAVSLALEALALFHVQIPANPDELNAEIVRNYQNARAFMKGRAIKDIALAPLVTNPNKKMLINLLSTALPCAFIGRPEYFPWLQSLALNACFKYGNTEASCLVYCAYGFVLFAMFDEPHTAYEFSMMGLELNQIFQDRASRGSLLTLHGAHFHYWSRSIRGCFSYMEQAFSACQESGDLVYAGFVAFEVVWQFLERGDPLDRVLAHSTKYVAFAKQTNNEPVLQTILLERQFILSLQGLTQSLTDLSDENFNECVCLSSLIESSFGCGALYFFVAKQMLYFYNHDYRGSLRECQKAEAFLKAATATPMEANYHFFQVLAIIGIFPELEESERQSARQTLQFSFSKMKSWAESCPDNFMDRYLLLEAEIHRLDGKVLPAMHFYERASAEARAQGYLQNQGLICELAGEFLAQQHLMTASESFLRQAHFYYGSWKAKGLVVQLERRYPFLRHPDLYGSAHTQDATDNLDIQTVAKATLAISSKIRFRDLAKRLVDIAVENAGADHGHLILVHEDGQTLLDIEGQPLPKKNNQNYPFAVLNFVLRTREPALLADAAGDEVFGSDSYIRDAAVKSLMCLPILRNERLSAILYLENRLLKDAFTAKRVTVLKVISAQAAISLDNAYLYNDLEQRVRIRTSELRQAQQKLVDAARRAGRAEIATNILHNVGNVLNSVNVHLNLIETGLSHSKIDRLDYVAQLLKGLSPLLRTDPRGRKLPEFFKLLTASLSGEYEKTRTLVGKLRDYIDHIIDIVRSQQEFSQEGSRLDENVNLVDLINEVLAIDQELFEQHSIQIVKDLKRIPELNTDKYKFLQILGNLINNAIDALQNRAAEDRRITVVLHEVNEEFINLSVADNGEGIDTADFDRIFQYGFTTRQDRKGFGLHACALAAQSLGGSLAVNSKGKGCGTSFELTFPANYCLPL